jgi:acid stress-induced BolA-like protein IbaG/YrbA
MTPEILKQLIETHLPQSTAIVEGEDGVHFSAIVITPEFVGKSRVQQQQLVYKAVDDEIKSGRIHALALKTFTPQDWALQHPSTFS